MLTDTRNRFEYRDIRRNIFRFKKIKKLLKIEYLYILEIFLNIKKK